MPPTLSVLMVSHNAGAFLAKAVQSVLRQTFADLELILVDNASSDGSIEKLGKAQDEPRLKIVSVKHNLGPYGGAQAGLQHCRGAFIARMDADDISHPRRFEIQIAALQAQPQLDAVACFQQGVDESGALLGAITFPCTHDDINRLSLERMPIAHPTLLVRRSVFTKVPYRSEFFCSGDYDFVLRSLESYRFASLPLTLYQYRKQRQSLTHSRHLLQLASGCAARLLAEKRAHSLPEDLRPEISWATQTADECSTRSQVLKQYASRAAAMQLTSLALRWERLAAQEDRRSYKSLRLARLAADIAYTHPRRLPALLKKSVLASMRAGLDALQNDKP